MRRSSYILVVSAVCGLLGFTIAVLPPHSVRAQGKTAADWKTANANPQRDAWVRTDFNISRQNMQSMLGWGVVRKVQLDTAAAGQQAGLPAFDLLASARGGYGFKSIGYTVDAAGNAIGIDSDNGIVYWKTKVGDPITGTCSGVLSAGVASITPLTGGAAAAAGRGRAGPANVPADFPGRGKSGSLVGAADEGAPSLKYYGIGAATAAPQGAAPAAGRGGRGATGPGAPGGAGGRGAAAGGTMADLPFKVAIPFPQVVMGAEGGGRGGGAPGVFALSSDGNLHSLSEQMGFDFFMAPTKFLPPNANAFGLVALEGTLPEGAAAAPAPGGGGGGRGGPVAPPILYVATANGCGSNTAGVWAIDLSETGNNVTSWKTNGGSVAGTAGPALGTDGTLYAATADGDYSPSAFSDSLVALQPKTLKLKDYFTPGKSAFVSSPVVFDAGGKDWIAVMNADGKMYLLDSSALGGSDHKTPASASAKFAGIGNELPGALASWQDTDGTRWVLTSISGTVSGSGFQTNGAVSNGAIVALKVVNGALQPGWVSHDISSPLAPIVVNGVVFTAGRGAGGNAVVYALDGSTGKEFLNTPLTGGAPKGSLSEQFATLYVQTADNTLWSLGFPQNKEDYAAVTH